MNDHDQDEKNNGIEEIIDIQVANGTDQNFGTRQVAFDLPSESASTVVANLAKSLESGLSKTKTEIPHKKKIKKFRTKRNKNLSPEVISWPSDSDITVLRMKLCLNNDMKDTVANVIPGDGLHQPDSFSMVNLATLVLEPQSNSKQSIDNEEYLLPVTSWEEGQGRGLMAKECTTEVDERKYNTAHFNCNAKIYEAVCSHWHHHRHTSSKDSASTTSNARSKLAKFLRLYFCPCSSCLYKIETMREDSSYAAEQRERTDS